jgi:hypothetical protein
MTESVPAAKSLSVYTLVVPNPEWTDDTEEDQVSVSRFTSSSHFSHLLTGLGRNLVYI